jgi:cytochrome c-type biogenesis protein CcmH/NrfG
MPALRTKLRLPIPHEELTMKHRLIAIACSIALAWPAAVLAAGGGGDEAPSSARSKDADYAAGMAAVKARNWQQVVDRMGAYTQRQPGDADGWNELGHAYRLLGRMDPAFDAYGKALKIDPRHRGAHEYLGEAYLQVNDVAKAEQELKTLDKLCFLPCEEYTDLKHDIEEYKKGKQAKAL